jgi:hypothetical protein
VNTDFRIENPATSPMPAMAAMTDEPP